jgi:hypothetical protein
LTTGCLISGHCENIAGVFQIPPLFEPPIEPGLLVQAAAQGLSLASVLNDLNSPMPNYRFYFLLQKALEVCNELKSLGAAFLSAKEKGEGEALARLRATHETSTQNLIMEVRRQQVDEAQKSLEALQQSRLGPVNRMQHYIQLIGEDLAKVPTDTTDFEGLTDSIEPPVDESGLKLIGFEKEEMDKAGSARDWQIGVGLTETLASILHIISCRMTCSLFPAAFDALRNLSTHIVHQADFTGPECAIGDGRIAHGVLC